MMYNFHSEQKTFVQALKHHLITRTGKPNMTYKIN